jgi:hypothetical protein
MATFQEQVEGLTGLSIGTSPTTDELTQFLTDGAKEIINQMPKHLLPLCSSEQSFTSGSPNTLNTGKILNVFRNDGDIKQPCRQIDSSYKGRVLDSDDMDYASVTDPVYYIENNAIDVIPVSGSVTYSEVQYPSVAHNASAISSFPDEAEYLVALYASVKSLQNKMSSKFSELPTDITLSTLPVAPLPPTLSSNQVASLGTAPSYTAPDVATDSGTIELTTIVQLDTENTIDDYDGNAIEVDQWWSTLAHMIEHEEDTELAQAQLQKISTYISAYSQAMQNQMNVFNKENVEYQASLQRAIENARLSSTDDSQLLQKYSSELGAYSTEVQIYQADASTKIQNYNAKIQKHITDYQWLSTQYAQLKDDYNNGLKRLISG